MLILIPISHANELYYTWWSHSLGLGDLLLSLQPYPLGRRQKKKSFPVFLYRIKNNSLSLLLRELSVLCCVCIIDERWSAPTNCISVEQVSIKRRGNAKRKKRTLLCSAPSSRLLLCCAVRWTWWIGFATLSDVATLQQQRQQGSQLYTQPINNCIQLIL